MPTNIEPRFYMPREYRRDSGWVVADSPFDLEYELVELYNTCFNNNKCFFCKKKIEDTKRRRIKNKKNKIYVCSNCEHLYQTIRNEYKSKNGKAVREIISFLNLYND